MREDIIRNKMTQIIEVWPGTRKRTYVKLYRES